MAIPWMAIPWMAIPSVKTGQQIYTKKTNCLVGNRAGNGFGCGCGCGLWMFRVLGVLG